MGATDPHITIAGSSGQESYIRKGTMTVQDVLNESPNACSFTYDRGTAPPAGSDIQVVLGATQEGGFDLTAFDNTAFFTGVASVSLFGGTVITTEKLYEGKPSNTSWRLTCQDYNYLISRRVPIGTFTGSASVVVQTLFNNFTSGFSGTLIEAGLPTVTITFDGTQSFNECLTAIKNLIAARWYVDYAKVLHFFRTESLVAPDPLDANNHTALNDPPITYIVDLTQIRSRVYVRGASSNVTIQNDQLIAVTSTTIPVSDVSHFSAGSVIDPYGNIITYTGTQPGNIATSALGVAGSPGTPNAIQWDGSATPNNAAGPAGGNLTSGTYGYKITYNGPGGETEVGSAVFATVSTLSSPGALVATVTAGASGQMASGIYQYSVSYRTNTGETIPGASVAITITNVTAPGALSAAAVSAAGNMATGTYQYKVSYVTTVGETLTGTATSVTIADVTAPGSFSAAIRTSSGSTVVGNLTTGTYLYRVSYRTSNGETVAGPPVSVTLGVIAPPVAPSVSMISGAAGNLQSGTYQYGVSFKTGNGETVLGSTVSITIPVVATPGAPSLANVSGASGNLRAGGAYQYKVSYLTANGETLPGTSTSVSISTIAAPAAPTATPTYTTPGVLYPGFYFYRCTFVTANGETVGGTTTFGFVTSITTPNFSGATAISGGTLPPGSYRYAIAYISSLGVTTANASGSISLIGALTAVNITGITTSSDPRVTGRALYRSFNGAAFQLISIFDNTSTNFIDGGFSATGSFPSSTDTASYGFMSLSSIPVSSDPRVTGRRIYRTVVGGSEYKFLNFIADNVTTTLIDNTPDVNLAQAPPTVSTADNGQVLVSGIAVSGDPRVQKRAVFRTVLGGSIYYRIYTINDNITTSITDNFADATIIAGGPPVSVSTANNGQVLVSAIPNSSDTRVTARNLYRTFVGGSTFLQITSIGSSAVTSFTDNVNDTSLTGNPPVTTDTANNGQVSLSLLPVSADARVTGRIIYRSKSGVSDYAQLATIGNNTDTTYTDNTADSSITGGVPLTVSTAANGQVTVSSIPLSADARVTSRAVYRTKAGGSIFYRLTTVGVATASFTDNTPDSSLTGDPPLTVSTADNGKVDLTSLPTTTDPRVTTRIVYRTKANGSVYYQLVGLQSTTLTHNDNTPDESLTGDIALTTSTANNGRVSVYNIPLGPGGTSAGWSRNIYRTKVNGSDYYAAGSVNNHTADDPTQHLDNVADSDLLDLAPTVTGVRTERGSSTLNVVSTIGFPVPGWVQVNSQIIYYSGISGNTLTGIPGIIVGSPTPTNDIVSPGAILSPIGAKDVAVVSMGMLTGVANIVTPLKPGDNLTLWVQRDDLAAQAALAALEGGDGIHEYTISDSTWLNVAQCNIAGDAELTIFSHPIVTMHYDTRDPKTASGKTIHVNLPAPLSLTGDLLIQSVDISEIGVGIATYPRFSVTASSVKFTLQDLIRRMQLNG